MGGHLSARRAFSAFFSYAHHDEEADADLIQTLAAKLEKKVNAITTAGRLVIWKDTTHLRAGEQWNSRIEDQIRSSDILIVLVSPSWIMSAYCAKEFREFLEFEKDPKEFILPIIIRPTREKLKYLSKAEVALHDKLGERQFRSLFASRFHEMSPSQREVSIDRLAHDIAHMMEALADADAPPPQKSRAVKSARREFTSKAQDFTRIDYLTSADVIVRSEEDGVKSILAQADFQERLYVSTEFAHVIFGIRRAYLTIYGRAEAKLSRVIASQGELQGPAYAALLDSPPGAISICIDPQGNQETLGPLSLPVSPGENRLSKIANANGYASADTIEAELQISLSTVDLRIEGEDSESAKSLHRKIGAIIDAAARRELESGGLIRRRIGVSET